MLIDYSKGVRELLESCNLARGDAEDEYFTDERSELRPSEVVQSKFIGLLSNDVAIPVSNLHTCRVVRR